MELTRHIPQSTGEVPMRILVVDDSRTMRLLVTRTLRQAGYGDHEIVEAGDGLEALEIIQSSQVDAVLCDWNMPRMTGLELLQALRGAGDLRLFGFITSETSPAMRGLAEHEGAAFVISKPFTAETFQSVLGGGVAAHAAIIHEGLPTSHDLKALLEGLLGREVRVVDCPGAVSPESAAAVWSYSFPDGTTAAVGTLDLAGALSLGATFGRLPVGRAQAEPGSTEFPADLRDNLREVLNVLVSLYHPLSDLPMRLGEVWPGVPDRPDIRRILAQTTGRLEAQIDPSGYPGGRFCSVYAAFAG